jgi:hypothetical protein
VRGEVGLPDSSSSSSSCPLARLLRGENTSCDEVEGVVEAGVVVVVVVVVVVDVVEVVEGGLEVGFADEVWEGKGVEAWSSNNISPGEGEDGEV